MRISKIQGSFLEKIGSIQCRGSRRDLLDLDFEVFGKFSLLAETRRDEIVHNLAKEAYHCQVLQMLRRDGIR